MPDKELVSLVEVRDAVKQVDPTCRFVRDIVALCPDACVILFTTKPPKRDETVFTYTGKRLGVHVALTGATLPCAFKAEVRVWGNQADLAVLRLLIGETELG